MDIETNGAKTCDPSVIPPAHWHLLVRPRLESFRPTRACIDLADTSMHITLTTVHRIIANVFLSMLCSARLDVQFAGPALRLAVRDTLAVCRESRTQIPPSGWRCTAAAGGVTRRARYGVVAGALGAVSLPPSAAGARRARSRHRARTAAKSRESGCAPRCESSCRHMVVTKVRSSLRLRHSVRSSMSGAILATP